MSLWTRTSQRDGSGQSLRIPSNPTRREAISWICLRVNVCNQGRRGNFPNKRPSSSSAWVGDTVSRSYTETQLTIVINSRPSGSCWFAPHIHRSSCPPDKRGSFGRSLAWQAGSFGRRLSRIRAEHPTVPRHDGWAAAVESWWQPEHLPSRGLSNSAGVRTPPLSQGSDFHRGSSSLVTAAAGREE